MKKRLVLAAAALALGLNVQAQSNAELNTRLQNGSVLIDQQKYELAMAELLPLTSTKSKFAADAGYLYSVAATRQKKWPEAEKALTQLLAQQPTWESKADAQYLLGQVYFERKEYQKALQTLAGITDPALQTSVAAMKRHYLFQLTDKTTFAYLQRAFPSDATLGKAYADRLVNGWFTEGDRMQLETLVRQFNLDVSYLNQTTALKKSEYNVAVLLPFNVTNGTARLEKKNLFLMDFYAGMLSAQDSLQKQGIKVNLFPYDTHNDTAQVRQVMQQPELGSMDFLVGPVYKSNSAFAAKIAQQRRLNMVNPFTDDLDLAKNNPYLFLLESSVASQGKQAATYAFETFNKKTAVLIFDSNKDDTTFASNFRRTYTALGGKILVNQKIDSKTSGSITAAMAKVNLKEVGVMVVQSPALSVATNTVGYLEQRASKTPLLVPSSWLEHNQISLAQFDFLEAYFLAPKFIDNEHPNVRRFKHNYTAKYNLPPSAYTYAGFELVYYYGKKLQENGYAAPAKLSGLVPGMFYQGINYHTPEGKSTQDNQYLPILKLEHGSLLVVNPVL